MVSKSYLPCKMVDNVTIIVGISASLLFSLGTNENFCLIHEAFKDSFV